MLSITSKQKLLITTGFCCGIFFIMGYILMYEGNILCTGGCPVKLGVKGDLRSQDRHSGKKGLITATRLFRPISKLNESNFTGKGEKTNEIPSQTNKIITEANENATSEMIKKRLVDSVKVEDYETKSEWDMFDGNNVDVVLFTCRAKWGFRREIYHNIKCPGTRRTITFRNALGNVTAASTADVVIFAQGVGSLNRLRQLKELRKKTPHQMWLYTTTESAYQTPFVPRFSTRFDTTFLNMSYCYHAKAEIVAPFGAYVQKREGDAVKATTQITPKPGIPALAAWASSHCVHNFWNRTGFVRDLSKHLPMDLFGACGSKLIPRNESGSEILKNYKFYIAFENSCCSYYITEKFWKALGQFESVPVVIGSSKSEYESVAPPNSFVYADDFDSMEDLADFIKKVAKNETLYNQFHEWRKYGKVEVYEERLVSPFFENESKCRLLNYLERNAWRKDHPIQMQIDPFGPDWAESCISCGSHSWISDYGLSSKTFTERLHSTDFIEI